MAESLSFDYYYGLEGTQFSFFRIPKLLIQDAVFQELSDRSKILYSIMLDRMSLSRAHGWLDKQNRVYIVFSIDNVAQALNCSKPTACKALSELDDENGIGLIKRIKRGQGKPDIIYVKNFISYVNNNPNVGKVMSWNPEDIDGVCDRESDLTGDDSAEVKIFESQKSNSLNSSFLNSRTLNPGSKSPLPQEVKGFVPIKTERIKTKESNTECTSSSSSPRQQRAYEEDDEDNQFQYYHKLIRENIEYDELQSYFNPEMRAIFEEVYNLICDVVCIPRETIRINGENYPYIQVRRQFLKLRKEHVVQVFEQLEQTYSKITNFRGYMLTALYNIVDTYMLSFSQGFRNTEQTAYFRPTKVTCGHRVQNEDQSE